MTDRAEIERLLNQTGRTLEGLPERYDKNVVHNRIREITGGWGLYRGMPELGEHILHQSDVIELLVGALRDALDEPMQKPLTHKEAEDILNSGVRVWIDVRGYYQEVMGINTGYLETEGYGTKWRCWASKPTDEEREAAAWES